MGNTTHNAIVITDNDDDTIEQVVARAIELNLQTLGPSDTTTNGHRSVLVCPDGGKEGWEDSINGHARRARLTSWLSGFDTLEWCEVAYGMDDYRAWVKNSPWAEPGAMDGYNAWVETSPRPRTQEQSPDTAPGLATIDYTDQQGNRSIRRIEPRTIEMDPDRGWILYALDEQTDAYVGFVMAGIRRFGDGDREFEFGILIPRAEQ